MMRVTITDETTGQQVTHEISHDELFRLSGVELAALLLPAPSAADVAAVNDFLAHYRGGGAS